MGNSHPLPPLLSSPELTQSHLQISIITPWPRVSGSASSSPYGDCSCCSLLPCQPLPAAAPCLPGGLPWSRHFCACGSPLPTAPCWSAPALAALPAVFSPHLPTLAPQQNHIVHTAFSLSYPCTALWTLQSILHSFY